MPEELEFATIDLALKARVDYYEHLHRDDNPQSKTVTFKSDPPGQAVIEALESQPLKIGQTPLSEYEKSRYNWAGPNGSPNIIEAQCVKAIAIFFGVGDWMAYWDPELSVSENFDIMRREGTRELTFEEKAKLGELTYPEQPEPSAEVTAGD